MNIENKSSLNHLIKESYTTLIHASFDDFFPLLEIQLKKISHQMDVLTMHLFILDKESEHFVCRLHHIASNASLLNRLSQNKYVANKVQYKLNKDVYIYKNLDIFNDLNEDAKYISYFIPLIANQTLLGFIHFFSLQDIMWINDQNDNEFFFYMNLVSLLLNQHILYVKQEKLLKENLALKEVKDSFLKNISHEIRTPLSGIHNAFYLLDHSNLSNEQKGYLDIGKSSLELMTHVLHDLVDFTHLNQGVIDINNDVFDLEDEMILLIHQFQQVHLKSNTQFLLDFDDQIRFKTIGDYRKIRQILINLIDNAVKYTRVGQISIKVELLSKTDHNASIKIEIKDTGIGVDESLMDHLNEPLAQADNTDTKNYQGLGLGLSIAHQYAKLIDADIKFSSQKYKGTDVVLTLDLIVGESIDFTDFANTHTLIANQSVFQSLIGNHILQMGGQVYDISNMNDVKIDLIVFEDVDINQSEIDRTRRLYGNEKTMIVLCHQGQITNQNSYDLILSYPISKQTLYKAYKSHLQKFNHQKDEMVYRELLSGHVMIVDDNRLNRLALESVLSKLGMRSTLVESGKKAIETVQRDNYDLIFMDVQMPVMDGIEATRKIRHLGKIYEDIPIIAVTANAYFKDYDLLKSAKINDVIFKPIQMDELNLIIRKHLNRKSKINIPNDLSIFDEIDFSMRFEGAMDIAKEVIDTFLVEYQKDLDKINQAIIDLNFEKIIETSHYFKGSCSYLSAKKAVWIIDFILNEAKRKNIDQMTILYQHLEESISELVVTLIKKNKK